MDIFENCPLTEFYNLGKLYVAFEKIHKLSEENEVLKNEAMTNNDENLPTYEQNSIRLQSISLEILGRARDVYSKLSDKDKQQLKSYLTTFKTLTSPNDLPYCTCDQKENGEKSVLTDLEELHNQLQNANKSIKDVQQINKDLKVQLRSLTQELNTLKEREKVCAENAVVCCSSEESEDETKDNNNSVNDNNDLGAQVAKSILGEIQDSIEKCLQLTTSDNTRMRCSEQSITSKDSVLNDLSEHVVISLEIVEVVNDKVDENMCEACKDHSDDTTEDSLDDINEKKTKDDTDTTRKESKSVVTRKKRIFPNKSHKRTKSESFERDDNDVHYESNTGQWNQKCICKTIIQTDEYIEDEKLNADYGEPDIEIVRTTYQYRD